MYEVLTVFLTFCIFALPVFFILAVLTLIAMPLYLKNRDEGDRKKLMRVGLPVGIVSAVLTVFTAVMLVLILLS